MPLLSHEEVGSLTRTSESVTVEWAIDKILSHTVADEYVYSPLFSGFNSKWFICICPFGEACTDSAGWISLYLYKIVDDSANTKNMSFSFNLKKVDGTFEKVYSNASFVFDNNENDATGEAKILKRSELKRRKSELAPSGRLTVTCTMMNADCLEPVSRLITLSENFKDMFLSRKECDITLKVQDQDFYVHKSVLACRCPVFETMFNINMKEKHTGVVDIVDCNPEAFREFLIYIYSGKFPDSSSKVFQLYEVAHKYMMQELISDCVIHMIRKLSVENVLNIAILAYQFDDSKLKTKVQDMFNKNFSDIADCTKWDSFLKDNYAVSNDLLKNMAKYMKKSSVES